MTLTDAIRHCEEVIASSKCKKCADEHRQLKAWLEELAELRGETE